MEYNLNVKYFYFNLITDSEIKMIACINSPTRYITLHCFLIYKEFIYILEHY